MKRQLHYLLLASAMMVGNTVSSASAGGSLHLDGIMLVRGDRSATARVVVTELHTPGMALDNVSGHFTLVLGLGRNYLISFERDGMVTKLVYFDTHVPVEQIGESFMFPFQVTLFEQGYNGVRAYEGPVGFVRYVPEKRDFVHRTDYRIVPGSMEDERMKELVERRTGAVVSTRNATPPVVRGDLVFARHGKRNGLFVGKAYDAEGRLVAEGRFLDADLKEKHGDFIYYYMNGKVESRGRFENSRKVGVWERFDMDGHALPERIYDADVLDLEGGSKAGTAPAAPPIPRVVEPPLEVRPSVAISAPVTQQRAFVGSTAHTNAITRPRGSAMPTRSATAVTAEDAVPAPALERTEELIVERQRVITVVRLPERTGHLTEYRRVADRHGSVLYFQDGRSIPYSSYHTATGR